MMQRLVMICLGLLVLVWQGQAAVVSDDLVLYGLTIESATSEEDIPQGVLDQPNKIRIINLGKVINHPGLDYGPTVSADGKTLYFVSDRKGSRITRDGDFSHDFWAAKKENNLDTNFFAPYNIDTLDAGVNTVFNEGVASIAPDGQKLYFTGCNRPDGLGDCDIYVAEIIGDRWNKPVNLGRNVNSEYWDSQPAISSDGLRLYYVSNRPSPTNPDGEGQEDTDIWFTEFDRDMEEWGPAKNLGPDINTPKQEVSPFIAADNQTLFFASNGHLPNMGGLDFYRTQKTGEKDRSGRDRWGKVKQLPAPINTAEDEQFITLPASGDVAYFSSRRQDIPGFQGDLDVFMAFIPTFFRAVNVFVNVVDECTGQNVPATLTFRNAKTSRTVNDSVTVDRTTSNFLVTNDDYGQKGSRSEKIQWIATATSPVYGQRQITIDVEDPGQTTEQSETSKPTEIRKTIMVGQRPQIAWNAAPSDWAKRVNDPFKGQVLEEKATITLFPLLPYIFFDLNSSSIPSRYIKFAGKGQTSGFSDERIPGGTFEKYYHTMNIYGYRLKKHPTVKVELVGCVDENNENKNSPLPKERAQAVYNYLRDVWGVEETRMKITARGWPEVRSNPNDTFGVVENRRTEIRFSGDDEEVWQVARPILDNDPSIFPSPATVAYALKNGIDDAIVASRRIEVLHNGKPWKTISDVGVTDPSKEWDWTNADGDQYPEPDRSDATKTNFNMPAYTAQLVVTSKNGTECKSDPVSIPVKFVSSRDRSIVRGDNKTLEKYNLILFPFDRYDAGPMNERILKEYVFGRVKDNSIIKVDGHTDVVGMFDHNKRLSENRAKTVRTAVERATGGKFAALEARGTGEEEPLYTNDLPEGRFFNRTVQVEIQTPITEEGTTN